MSEMKSKLFIVGLGATAEEIRLFVEKYGLYDIAGFAVNQRYISTDSFHGYPIYAIEKLDELIDKENDLLFVALFWNHLNNDRRKLYEELKKDGYRFATLISPKSDINQSYIGENCWISDNVYIKPNVRINDNTFINAGAIVEINTTIGKHCFIATGAVVGGSCRIEDQCFVGLNATIFDHTVVGHHSIIGAATAIKRNVSPCTLVKTSSDTVDVGEYQIDEICEKLVVQKNIR